MALPISNICRWRRRLALVKFFPKMETWRSREGNYLSNITQKVHDEAGMGSYITYLLSNSLSLRENNATATLGRAVTSPCFCTLTSGRHHCMGLSPPPYYLYLALKTRFAWPRQKSKGRPDCRGLERGGRTKRSGSVGTAGKSLTLRSLERRSSNPHDDRVELQYKCFHISVARKQMTC